MKQYCSKQTVSIILRWNINDKTEKSHIAEKLFKKHYFDPFQVFQSATQQFLSDRNTPVFPKFLREFNDVMIQKHMGLFLLVCYFVVIYKKLNIWL